MNRSGGELFGLIGIFPSTNRCVISYSRTIGELVFVMVGVGIYAWNNVHCSVVTREENAEDSCYLVRGCEVAVVAHYGS